MPVPAPKTWTDGEEADNIPSADDLNLDWRDSFDFLLGNTRPIGLFHSTSGQALTTTATNITFNVEDLKRTLTHSTVTNSHLITVPYAGQYVGFAMATFDGPSSATARMTLRVLQNTATTIAKIDQATQNTTLWTVNGSFTANLAANDTLGLSMTVSTGTATAGTVAARWPRLAIWYAGDFQ